ncbi:MAG: DNA mismatch endonuclease Vsr [Chloracidobacterium sp.]|nr:DNA mismatch endonuclease Vsr [Chloracidobacterium sp.]
MADNLTVEQRRKNMTLIRSRDTKPEMLVRSLLHSRGYRFRLHHPNMPGKPDIVLPRYRKIILVNGCFWHGHNCKRGRVSPKTNASYWSEKIARNRTRDRANRIRYTEHGWQTMIVWECQIKDIERLAARLLAFLSK